MRDLNALTDAQLAAIAGEIDPDTDALVRTVWGEARNQSPQGRKAVAAVIRNRAKLSGQPISAVVQEPGQFEPWGDPQVRPQLERLDPASDAYQAILADVEGDDDPTGGATHFYAPKAQAALGRKPPKWDDGTGADIGDHRFFKLSYGGQPVPESEPAPDLESLSDEDLEAIATAPADEPPAPRGEVVMDDVEFTSAPGSARTAHARKSTIVDAEEGQAATPEQEAWYVGEIKAGRLNPEKVRAKGYRAGSEEFPLLQRSPEDMPKPGDWYVTPQGEKKQVPEVPMADTAVSIARLIGQPGFATAAAMEPDLIDPRAAAMKRALESGVMLGGRNELVAGIDSLGGLLEGGIPKLQERFGERLESEDKASAQARRDFPIAYDASAVAGGLGSSVALPSSLVPRLTTGAGAGFLATDGDLQRRAVGAGLGVVGGEALRVVAPKLIGAGLDMAGVPLRQAGGSAGEIKAAEAVRRSLQRDEIPTLSTTGADMPFQAGGQNLTALAEVVAQSPGKGANIVRQAVRDQQAGASDRIRSEVGKATGGDGSYFARLDEAKAARRKGADEGMAKLGDHEVRLDENSISALRSDLARSAVREQALNSLASPDAAVREAGARLNRLYDDLLDKPGGQTITVRDAQNISKSLLDAADDAYKGGNGSRGKALKDLGKAVRENAATPERGGFADYGSWLKRYAEDSDAIDALEAGRNVFSGKMDVSAEALRKEFAAWPDAAKENFRVGVGEAIVAAVNSKGGVAQARQMLKSQEFADRVRVAVPDDMSFSDFMTALEKEVVRADRNNRVVGGSPTYARQAARADLEAQGRDPLDMAAEAIDTGLSPARLTAKGLKGVLSAIPRKDRSVIGNPAANEALGRALTDPDEMTRLLNMLEHYQAIRTIPKDNMGVPSGYVAGAVASERR